MKSKTKYLGLLAIVIIAGLSGMFIHDNQDIFSGSRVKNPDCYILQFEKMNQKDSHQFILSEGNAISADYSIDKGNVTITIGKDGEKPIYSGSDIKKDSFSVTVPEDGTYIVTIDAKHAAGYIMTYTHEK